MGCRELVQPNAYAPSADPGARERHRSGPAVLWNTACTLGQASANTPWWQVDCGCVRARLSQCHGHGFDPSREGAAEKDLSGARMREFRKFIALPAMQLACIDAEAVSTPVYRQISIRTCTSRQGARVGCSTSWHRTVFPSPALPDAHAAPRGNEEVHPAQRWGSPAAVSCWHWRTHGAVLSLARCAAPDAASDAPCKAVLAAKPRCQSPAR